MDERYTLSIEDQPAEEDARTVAEGLRAYNRTHTADDNYRSLGIFLRDGRNGIVGGLLGHSHWGWLHVKLLWVDEALREEGFGTRLLQAAEEEAVRRGCRHVYLDTMSFQALPFYLKQGYTVWGKLDDMPPGHSRYFLKKDFPASPGAAQAQG